MAPPEKMNDLSRLCIHTQTNKPWDLARCVEHYHRAGVQGISVWRHLLDDLSPQEARRILEDHDMKVVSLVRGGFFAAAERSRRELAIEDNLKAIDQATSIGSPMVVLVCGSDPEQSQEHSRDQIREGILRILSAAEVSGVKLAIEPLHPMYAADRSAITTISQANDLAEEIHSEFLGVAVDVFHLWWDPFLLQEIRRCGKMEKLFAFHVSDWNVPLKDMLNDRGLMGDGCIDLKRIRGWMEDAGFNGYCEVEVFSDKYWAMDQLLYLEKIIDAYLKHT